MKLFNDNGKIAIVKVDQAAAHHCYNASLEVQKAKKEGTSGQYPPSEFIEGHDSGPRQKIGGKEKARTR